MLVESRSSTSPRPRRDYVVVASGLLAVLALLLFVPGAEAVRGTGVEVIVDAKDDSTGGPATDLIRAGAGSRANNLYIWVQVDTKVEDGKPKSSDFGGARMYWLAVNQGDVWCTSLSTVSSPAATTTAYDAGGANRDTEAFNTACEQPGLGYRKPIYTRWVCNELEFRIPYASLMTSLPGQPAPANGNPITFQNSPYDGTPGGPAFQRVGFLDVPTDGMYDGISYNLGAAFPIYPEQPAAPTATVLGDNKIQVSWALPAANDAQPVTAYRIYRSVDGGSYQFVQSVAATSTSYVDAVGPQSEASTPAQYRYKVSAVNCADLMANTASPPAGEIAYTGGEGLRSAASNSVTPDFRPAAPVLDPITAFTPTQVDLSWSVPADGPAPGTPSNVQGYRVYRGVTPGVTTADTLVCTVTLPMCQDATAQPGTDHYYRVQAFDGLTPTANRGPLSNEVMVRTPPAIIALDPASGPTWGGTFVTLTGSGFAPGATVTLDGEAVDSLTYVDDATLTFVTLEHAAGPVDLTVTNGGGGESTMSGGYTYIQVPVPAPTLDVGAISAYVGTGLTLDATHLGASHDLAGPADLVYTVEALPTRGTFSLDGVPFTGTTTFTQDDVDQGRITFSAGNQPAFTSLGVRVSFSGKSTIGTLPVEILPEPVPLMTQSGPFSLSYGATRTIGPAYLLAGYAWANDPGELVFTVTNAPDPAAGDLLLDGAPLGATFTQADINAGRLSYAAGMDGASTSLGYRVDTADGKSVTGTMLIIVSEPVPPSATIFVQQPLYAGVATDFEAFITQGTGDVAALAWDMGDGNDRFGAAITHTYAEPGTYFVRLNVSDDDDLWSIATKAVLVVVDVPMDASFSVGAQSTSIGSPLRFTDTSTTDGPAIALWLWDFGDGAAATSSQAGHSVQHAYAKPGIYEVRLTIKDAAGLSTHATTTIVVEERVSLAPEEYSTVPPVVAKSGIAADRPTAVPTGPEEAVVADTVTLDGSASLSPRGRGLSYQWMQSGGPPVAVEAATAPWATFVPLEAGTYEFRLVVHDGIAYSEAAAVQVDAVPGEPGPVIPPDASFGVEATPAGYSFEPAAKGVAYRWDFGDGTTSLQPWPIHRYQESGSYKVQLTVTDQYGARATHTMRLDAQGLDADPAPATIHDVAVESRSLGDHLLLVAAVTFGVLAALSVVLIVRRTTPGVAHKR